MAIATLTGLVDDSDILQNERVIDMDEAIAMLDPDTSQFTTMLMRVARSAAESTKNEWLEDQLFPRLSSVASGGATDGATIVVAAGEGAYFRVGDIIRNAKTGVSARLTTVATDTLTPTVALGRVAFAAHTAGDQILIVGNAAAQGATLGTEKQTKRVAQYNYQTIQRNPYVDHAAMCILHMENQAKCWKLLRALSPTKGTETWDWTISRKDRGLTLLGSSAARDLSASA